MTIDDLKIDPKFRDLIPKLNDAEYKQLEENILADGRVKEPIVVWGNTIVDGHHRYYILKNHPEIPYEIEQREFANEYAAMAWACANQLGRRNLSNKDASYLRGKQYESEKKAHRGAGKAKITEQDVPTDANSNVAEKIGKEHGVSHMTVKRDEQFAKGVDIVEQVVPGIREDILNEKINVPKTVLRKLSKATPDKQRKASIAISQGKIEQANRIVSPYSDTIESLTDKGEIEFTEEDLLQELTQNFQMYMRNLATTISSHKEIISDSEIIIDRFIQLLNEEVKKLEERKNERV